MAGVAAFELFTTSMVQQRVMTLSTHGIRGSHRDIYAQILSLFDGCWIGH